MKKIAIGILILILSIFIGYSIKSDPGYILIYYHEWSIATSLWIGAIIVILSFFLLYAVIRLLKKLININNYFQRWNSNRQQKKSSSLTDQGAFAFLEYNYEEAEKTFKKAASINPSPFIDYIAAAVSAQKLKQYKNRDFYILKAKQTSDKAMIAVLYLQIHFFTENKQWEFALDLIDELKAKTTPNKYYLPYLITIYKALDQWNEIEHLLPQIKRYKIYSEEIFLKLEIEVYNYKLRQASKENNVNKVKSIWSSLSRGLQKNNELIHSYVVALIETHQNEIALTCIATHLKKYWNSKLLKLYADISTNEPSQKLINAKHWLKDHPNDPDLLMCLAQISIQQEFWGKAYDYLLMAKKFSDSKVILKELGYLAEKQNEPEKAIVWYKKALKM